MGCTCSKGDLREKLKDGANLVVNISKSSTISSGKRHRADSDGDWKLAESDVNNTTVVTNPVLDEAVEDENGIVQQVSAARFEINISHIKGRGAPFMQSGWDFFVRFTWAGAEKSTSLTAASSAKGGCKWDSLIHFDYQNYTGAQYSDSINTLHDNVIQSLESNTTPAASATKTRQLDKSKYLIIHCIGLKKHHLREEERMLVGSVKVDLETVMSGPLHHVFVLKSPRRDGEVARLSYNCRITQFAHWRLLLSYVKIIYDDPQASSNGIEDDDQSGPRGTRRSSQTSVPDVIHETASFESETSSVSASALRRSETASRDDEKAKPVTIAKSLLQLESPAFLKSIQDEAALVDHTRRFALRYSLHKPDSANPAKFDSRISIHPRMDALGTSFKSEWSANQLPPVQQSKEDRFRSFLSATLAFQLYELNDQHDQHTPIEKDKNGSERAHLLPAQDSHMLFNSEDGRLLGECWTPVEQLFESAQQNSAELEESSCFCFSDMPALFRQSSTISEPKGEHGDDSAAVLSSLVMKRTQHPASVKLEKEIRFYGKQVGKLMCSICFDRLPGSMQLGHGVLTEEGVSLISPIILQGSGRPTLLQRMLRNGEQQFSSPACRKLQRTIQRLEKTLKATPRRSPMYREEQYALHREYVLVCAELLLSLHTSEKESMTVFMYNTTTELFRTQSMLIGLWELLIEWMDAVSFTVRIHFFDVISAILLRGEMSEFMMIDFFSGVGPQEAQKGKESEAAKIALSYREVCYRTLAWVLNKLSQKGSFTELRTFCAKIVAAMCFRLPKFGSLVYQAILPDDETSIKEWAKSKALRAVLPEGSKRFDTPEWDSGWFPLDVAVKDGSAAPESPRRANQRKIVGNNDNEGLLNWKPFHRTLEKVFSKAQLEKQEALLPMGSKKGGVFIAPMWLRRMQKHGHFFFLLAREWIIYVLSTLGHLATPSTENFEGRTFKSGIRWHKLPGYKHLLKAFLLELRRRDVKDLPESLRALSMLFLVDDKLIGPFVNIIIPKTNVFDLDNVTASIDLISAWITTLHGWPGRFVVAKIFRSNGPLTAAEADAVLQGANSLFFQTMEQTKLKKDEQDRDILKEAKINVLRNGDSDVQENFSVSVEPPPAPLAQMRAAGSLANKTPSHTVPKFSYGSYTSVEHWIEPFVTPWDFDSVSVYFPHLDIVRRNFKKAANGPGANNNSLGITSNNDRSKCNWYSHLYADTPPVLPRSFEFKLFAHMLWVLLHVEHFQVILKTLELIYNHWHAFPGEFQDKIRMMMLAHDDARFSYSANMGRSNTAEQQGQQHTFPSQVVPQAVAPPPQDPSQQNRHHRRHDGKVCLFLTLFYHWQEDVRYFFQTLLAYRLCRGQRSKYYDRLVAAIRIALMSTEEAVWDRVWKGDDEDEKHNCRPATEAGLSTAICSLKRPALSKLQDAFLVGKALHKRFEEERVQKQEEMKSKSLLKSFNSDWLSKKLNLGGSSETPPSIVDDYDEEEELDDIVKHTKSMDAVSELLREISSKVFALPASAVVNSHEKALVRGSIISESSRALKARRIEDRRTKIKQDVENDLNLLGFRHWPTHLRPYAIPAVAKFRKLWIDSLDSDRTPPHLEWSVVVMDRGEMRSVGGLAHFRSPSNSFSGGM